jgi:hypothetical protein
VTGTGFTSSSAVKLNGTVLPTTYISPFELLALIPASTSYAGEPIVVVNSVGTSLPFTTP